MSEPSRQGRSGNSHPGGTRSSFRSRKASSALQPESYSGSILGLTLLSFACSAALLMVGLLAHDSFRGFEPRIFPTALLVGCVIGFVALISLVVQLRVAGIRDRLVILRYAGVDSSVLPISVTLNLLPTAVLAAMLGATIALALRTPLLRWATDQVELSAFSSATVIAPTLMTLAATVVMVAVAAVFWTVLPSTQTPARTYLDSQGARFRRFAIPAVWGTVAMLLGLEIITIGSQHWVGSSHGIVVAGVLTFTLGLLALSPSLFATIAWLILWPFRRAGSGLAAIATADLRGHSRTVGPVTGVVVTNAALLAATIVGTGFAERGSDTSFFVATSALRSQLGLLSSVGCVTIVCAVSIWVLQRNRQLVDLRMQGLTHEGTVGLVGLESLLMGLYAATAGAVAGIGLGLAVNAFMSGGGTPDFTLKWGLLAACAAATVVVTTLAGVISALIVTRHK